MARSVTSEGEQPGMSTVGDMYEDIDREIHVMRGASNENLDHRESSRPNTIAYVDQSPEHAIPDGTAIGSGAASYHGESSTPRPRFKNLDPACDLSPTIDINNPRVSKVTNILYPSHIPECSVEHSASAYEVEDEVEAYASAISHQYNYIGQVDDSKPGPSIDMCYYEVLPGD